jgi:hypothetical protein
MEDVRKRGVERRRIRPIEKCGERKKCNSNDKCSKIYPESE